jgi:hypothetical protein
MFKRLRSLFAHARTPEHFEDERAALEAASHAEFERVREEAQLQGLTVCGVITPSGRPRYWVSRPDVQPIEVASRGFEIREGRPPTADDRAVMAAVIERTSRG